MSFLWPGFSQLYSLWKISTMPCFLNIVFQWFQYSIKTVNCPLVKVKNNKVTGILRSTSILIQKPGSANSCASEKYPEHWLRQSGIPSFIKSFLSILCVSGYVLDERCTEEQTVFVGLHTPGGGQEPGNTMTWERDTCWGVKQGRIREQREALGLRVIRKSHQTAHRRDIWTEVWMKFGSRPCRDLQKSMQAQGTSAKAQMLLELLEFSQRLEWLKSSGLGMW